MKARLLAPLALLLLLALSPSAQTPAKRAVTPEDLLGMTRLRGVALSPDGKQVLYEAARREHPLAEKLVGHLYLVPSAGGTPRQMTASEAGESWPAWSPDGERIAFVSRRSGAPQVFVMPADGGEGIQVGKLKVAPSSAPEWSPGGESLAFLAVPEPSASEQAEEKESGGVEIVEQPKDLAQLFTLSYPEGKASQVTPGEYNVSSFAWAPDGRSFALVTAKSQLLYDNMTASAVRAVDLSGKTLAVLSPKDGPLRGPPRFSPDGKRVAWHYPTRGLSLMNGAAVASADGKSFRNAAEKLDLHFSQLEWAPDGQSLVALTQEGTRSVLSRLDLSTGRGVSFYAPAGVVSGFQMDRKGELLAFDFSDPSSPAAPWAARADGTGALRIADLNPQAGGWLLPSTEKLRYESAKGVSVEALFDRTPLPPKEGLPPLMVMPHGGPDGTDQEGFDAWVAYFTGQGYSVLRVNFRGSLAYGMDFYAANRGQQGFVDYDDVMAGVDLLVSRKLADPEKLVIGGWSYGGCFTEWAITRTDRFKAAVVGAGVANYVSNYAQSDINHGVAAEWEFLGNPYDNPENFTKGSAVFHIRSVKTPVLILNGKEDPRVPYAQGLELYRALKTTSKQVEMVAYPGAGHGPRKPQHIIDVLKRWSAFYDRALGIVRTETGKQGASEPGKEQQGKPRDERTKG